MKTRQCSERFTTRRNIGLYVAGVLTTVMLLRAASAQEGTAVSGAPRPTTQTSAAVPASATTPAAQPEKPAEPSQRPAVTLSADIEGILKLVQAGVSKEVIKTYIESSPIAFNPSATDLIALKEHGVSDDITGAVLKRGAEVRAQARQASAPIAVPAPSLSYPSSSYLDPESYDFWWYHYAYPRTLAAVYERLSPYYPPYAYGYSQSWPFRPRVLINYPRPRY